MPEAVATPDLLTATLAEEDALRVAGFSHEDARRLGGCIAALAEQRGLPVTVVVQRGEQIAFQAGFAGSSAENDDWARRKAATVRRHDRSSLAVRFEADLGRPPTWLDPAVFAVSGGSVPVRLTGGELVGTATVSGLPDSDDHALVVEGIRAFLA